MGHNQYLLLTTRTCSCSSFYLVVHFFYYFAMKIHTKKVLQPAYLLSNSQTTHVLITARICIRVAFIFLNTEHRLRRYQIDRNLIPHFLDFRAIRLQLSTF